MKLKSLSQKDRYGNMFSFEFFEPDASIPMMMVIPDMADGYNGADTSNHPGEPKGTDTVPAWLTPGENVVNAEASRLPGNQEKIDEMNEQGRAVQQAQGGPIPTYAAGGMEVPRYDGMLNSLGQRLGDRDGGPMYSAAGDFVTNSLLDRIRRIESGGDPNATSEAGAMGQYQIMPATAAQPGYGVTPLAAEDIRDPVKSREFARQYLMGIAAANPDFTEDEVITAYHSGVGNVRKAKEGTEALGPRGQAYAGKVNNAEVFPQELIDRGVTPSDLTQSDIESGMFSANAATLPPVPTGGQGSGQYLPDAAAQAAGMGVPVIDNIPPVTSPYSEDIILDNKGRPQAVNPNRISKDIPKQIAETFAKNGDREMYDRRMAEYNQAVKQNEANQKYKKEQAIQSATTSNAPIESNIANIDAEILAAKAAGNTVLADALKARKSELEKELVPVPEADKVPPKPEDTTETTQKKNAAGMVMQQLGPVNEITLEGEAGINQLINSLPKDPEAKSKFDEVTNEVGGWFKDTFSSMFSGPEIARMFITYAGSRIMGYNHGDSLNYSMKNYVKRIDSDLAARKEFITNKDNLKNYTAKSLKLYLETGDIGVLEDKGGTVKKVVPGDYYIVPGMTGMQAAVDVDGVPMLTVKVNGKLERVNAASIGAKKVIPENSPIELAKSFDSAAKQAFERVNKGVKEENQLVPLTSLGGAARDLVMEDIAKEAADTSNQGRIKTAMRRALDKYADANLQFKKDDTSFGGRDPVNSLLYFYRQERIAVDNPGLNMKYVEGADPYKLADLMNTVQQEVNQSKTDAKVEFKAMNNKWNKILERKRKDPDYNMGSFEDKERTDGHTAFTWWMSQIYANNPTAEQLFNDN